MPEPETHETKRKVDFSVFVWVVSILSGAMLTIAGFLFSEVTTLRTHQAEETGRSNALVRELAAKLEAEKDKSTSVLVTLAEIKGDLRLVRDQLERRPVR